MDILCVATFAELGVSAWRVVLQPTLSYYASSKLRRARYNLIIAGLSQLFLSVAVILSFLHMISKKPASNSNSHVAFQHAFSTLMEKPLILCCGMLVLMTLILHTFRPVGIFENRYTRLAKGAIIILSLLPYLQQTLLLGEIYSFSNPLVHLLISLMLVGKSAVCRQYLRPYLPQQSLLMIQILLRIVVFAIECRNEAHDTSRIIFLTLLLVWHLHLSSQLSGLRGSAVTWALYLCTTGSGHWDMEDFLRNIATFFATAPNAVPNEETTTQLMIFRSFIPLLTGGWLYSQEDTGFISLVIVLGLAACEIRSALAPPHVPGARLELLLGVQLSYARELLNVPHRAVKVLQDGKNWVLNIPSNQHKTTPEEREMAKTIIEVTKEINARKRATSPPVHNPDAQASKPEIVYQVNVRSEIRTLLC